MNETLTQHKAIEIKIANVGLVPKLDALGAAISAVREAHRYDIPPKCWAALHRAQEALADAILSAGSNVAIEQAPRPTSTILDAAHCA
jgi:hypothetical protein